MTGVVVLLRADLRRLVALARRPTASVWVGAILPALVLAVGVWASGAVGGARLDSVQDGVTLGVLVGGPLAFLAYGTLFRGSDDGFLRRLGVRAEALYLERALRLLAWGAGVAVLVGLAFTAGGVAPGRLLLPMVVVVLAAWGAALLSTAAAGRAMALRTPGTGWGCLAAGMWDREVAAAAPLVYAPVPPLVAAGVSGGAVLGSASPLVAGAVVAAAGVIAAAVGVRVYAAALPRFAPQAVEMSFAPRPATGDGELRIGWGLTRLLPRRPAAVLARDGAVAGRRFAWASRAAWPVVAFSLVALARWGQQPATRTWVVSAVVLVLVIQGAVTIGLGRAERRGPRWLDRAVGVSVMDRFVGRWAWGWGLSLWVVVPVALAWSWWSGMGSGWGWVGVAAGTSGAAAAASVTAAGRR